MQVAMESVEQLCSPQVLRILVNKVHQHLGPDFSGPRRADLLRRLRLLAHELEIVDLPAWLEALAFAQWDAAQVQALTPAFTVGETYFRRDAEALAWLRQHLGPLLAQRRAEGRQRLRLWSAACCTGEEAYSLLFLLDELLGADAANWSVEVYASDLNEVFLHRAEHGSYGQNAFRLNDEAFRSCYFQAEERQWRVRPQWRGRIRFLRHNLVGDPLPCPQQGLHGFDVILCRNVLMYFSPERAGGVLRRLLACLAGEGVLLISAVEASLATQAGLAGFWAGCNYALRADATRPARSAPMELAMASPAVQAAPPAQPVATKAPEPRLRPPPQESQRQAAEPQVTALEPAAPLFQGWPVPPVAAAYLPLWQRVVQAQAQGQPTLVRQLLLEYLASAAPGPLQAHQVCLLLARSWADQHATGEAEEWLRRALSLEPCSAPSYWLLALLAEQNGTLAAALVSLQKALYLEPDFILAHFHQARLLRLQGQEAAAAKALQLCRELLRGQPGDAAVPLGDGLSCGQLQRICEQLLEERAPCSNP
ncbi:hypothetical protein A9179_09435 [Pseudomonas alcaligenes]|uniref:CheR-type methyltransferase domain-containing protein n=1 Tax=Aquipseudomonas alcaligenes TaxID=43263 RepID=A0ABR7RZ77_AQUAC|nr:hypothetical protein [Pseudomonas alcaligenes]